MTTKTKLTLNSVAYPQTVEVPAPMEIHPSIPADLAREMLRVADLFSRQPEAYHGRFSKVGIHYSGPHHPCGCICAYIVGETSHGAACMSIWPAHSEALRLIYEEASLGDRVDDPAWAIARIERFLRTAT